MGAVALLSAAMSACNNPSGVATGGGPGAGAGIGSAAALVGAWDCVNKSGGAVPDVRETQTFGADGWFSSSKHPEGKKYKYRLENEKLVLTFPTHEWSGKINNLTNGSLEYSGDASDQSKVACKKN